MAYYIYYVNENGNKCYLTSIGNENPLAGIGFEGNVDGSIPKAAGTTPTIEDAEKIIDYLHEAISTPFSPYKYEEEI